MSSSPKCPICGKPVVSAADAKHFPFCGERCRIIDLGNWLSGKYRIAGPPASDRDLAEQLAAAMQHSPDGSTRLD